MELQRHLSDFTAADVRLFAISNDPPEVLAAFATEFGIEYPLLSDAGSVFIRELGILNTLIDPDETVYGIPYPGVYVIDSDRRVTQKLFHRLYTERDASARLLRLAFGEALRPGDTPLVSADADDVRISVELATRSFVFMQLTELYVQFALPNGLHINGAPVPEGYIPTTVLVSGPDGPRSVRPSTRKRVPSQSQVCRNH